MSTSRLAGGVVAPTIVAALLGAALLGPTQPAAAQSAGAAPATTATCAPGPTPSPTTSGFNTTPAGRGPWRVPRDPCNSEPLAHWTNCAYWGEEKRPDIWRYAVDNESGEYIAWQVKGDAAKYGFHINHTPQVGDLAAWPPNATMGTEKSGNRTIVHIASAGGHLAYVQHVHGQRIAISTTGIDSHGGYTFTIKYNQRRTFFIHRGRSAT